MGSVSFPGRGLVQTGPPWVSAQWEMAKVSPVMSPGWSWLPGRALCRAQLQGWVWSVLWQSTESRILSSQLTFP